ncbi:hypothetical protein KC19_4G015200 [Ceratodon purpureus]|uniref:Uncharacterized protein n=1 Tax=Ceratodon purpureus TaxID=3225 RepID=A0A8T0I469_CERPU|nr:hypothetical protein KC19_4G015200 [Ceratodon purpureus]
MGHSNTDDNQTIPFHHHQACQTSKDGSPSISHNIKFSPPIKPIGNTTPLCVCLSDAQGPTRLVTKLHTFRNPNPWQEALLDVAPIPEPQP